MAAEMPGESWYWCLRHDRAEPETQRCRAADSLGPYPSKQEASSWKERVEERNERWEQQDRTWSGEDEDD